MLFSYKDLASFLCETGINTGKEKDDPCIDRMYQGPVGKPCSEGKNVETGIGIHPRRENLIKSRGRAV